MFGAHGYGYDPKVKALEAALVERTHLRAALADAPDHAELLAALERIEARVRAIVSGP